MARRPPHQSPPPSRRVAFEGAGGIPVAVWLLSQGCRDLINEPDDDGWSPLYRAIQFESDDSLIEWMQANGATVKAASGAADNGSSEVANPWHSNARGPGQAHRIEPS